MWYFFRATVSLPALKSVLYKYKSKTQEWMEKKCFFPQKERFFISNIKKKSSCWLNHPCDIGSFAIHLPWRSVMVQKCQEIFETSTYYIQCSTARKHFERITCCEDPWWMDWLQLPSALTLLNHRISIPNSDVFKLHDCGTTNIIIHSIRPPYKSKNQKLILS